MSDLILVWLIGAVIMHVSPDKRPWRESLAWPVEVYKAGKEMLK